MLKITNDKLVLAWGLVASLFVFSITLKYEVEKEKNSFANFGSSIVARVESVFGTIDKINREFSALFYLTDEVDSGEFNFLTNTLVRQNKFIETIYFAEKISAKDKKQYELNIEEQGYTGFKVKPFPVPLSDIPNTSEYKFPVKFISPYSVKTSRWFGMDLLTFPVVNKRLSQSLNRSSLVYATTATEKNRLFASRILFNASGGDDDGDLDDAFGILLYKIDVKNIPPLNGLAKSDFISMQLDNSIFLEQGSLGGAGYLSTVFSYDGIINLEGQIIDIRVSKNKSYFQFNLVTPLMILAASLFLTIFAWFVIRSHIEHNEFLAEQNCVIEEEVYRKTKELNKKANELAMAYNRQLALVEELESFSYSVSHDLRSPLRAIDGFSRALDEDYGDQLDATAKDFLMRICKASERMGTLIDALLSLSRISRKGLLLENFSISEMAEDIIKTLREEDPDRDIKVIIHPSITAKADKSLVYIVMDNLLRNAWKYTARQANPVIEVGKTSENGETVFFVKDNGVGFDMAYARKLFESFHRLHREADFEGNGIGLATAKRIISRHSGKIWADATLDKGATFFFTLPELKEDFQTS